MQIAIENNLLDMIRVLVAAGASPAAFSVRSACERRLRLLNGVPPGTAFQELQER